ncbi:MAG: hypothetical protein KGN39_02940 [Betaproteobacteria bacterium]|nr:hypothetical protein [Betaproteobacteria bacterium]
MGSKRSLRFLLALVPAVLAVSAQAADYRSVAPTEGNAAILYDAPSKKGVKRFIIRRYTPVEVVVSLEGWAKVRDAAGGLAWIERACLSDRRTVQVVADRAEVRQAADANAPLVFEAEKGVALDWLETAPPGWVRVKHVDGQSGFVRANQVWGL